MNTQPGEASCIRETSTGKLVDKQRTRWTRVTGPDIATLHSSSKSLFHGWTPKDPIHIVGVGNESRERAPWVKALAANPDDQDPQLSWLFLQHSQASCGL